MKTTKKQQLYTTPKICKCANDEWFIFFRYFNAGNGKMQPVKRAEGLNRIHDLIEKEAEAKALCEAREIWLKMGWNPITDPRFEHRPEQWEDLDGLEELQKMDFEQAVDFAYKSKCPDWSKKTKQDYASVIKYLKE